MRERRTDRRLWDAIPQLLAGVVLASAAGLALSACTPTVQVVAPKEPITINLNIKLDADVRLRIEEKAKEDVKTQPIF
ncbi:MAG TPA: YnbE family lipoprotein [Dongiaceae bacterium]